MTSVKYSLQIHYKDLYFATFYGKNGLVMTKTFKMSPYVLEHNEHLICNLSCHLILVGIGVSFPDSDLYLQISNR